MLDSATKQRFEEALASERYTGLKDLADQMTREGLSQVAIYLLFESFQDFLNEQHRQADEEIILGCLECIIGYCAQSSKWFEHYLTNEEIDEYRKTKP